MPQLYQVLIATTLLCCFRNAVSQELPNGGFDEGLAGWVLRPGEDSQVSLADDDGDRGQSLELSTNTRLLGVETLRLVMGQHIYSEPPLHEGWPVEITADVGDLQVRFESRSFWTLYRIDYKGTRLCLDRWGSHYGSVVRFPNVGFIGSGHTENEDEQILELQLVVDGLPIERPESRVQCRQLKLQKKSRIRDLVLHTEIQVRDNCVYEGVRMVAEKPTPVNLIYHFMHPWTTSVTEYLAELPDATRVEGRFQGDGGQKIDRVVRWSAIYDDPSGKGAVTYMLDTPADDSARTRYWDVSGGYRKHYLATFLDRTVPANEELHYRVVTVPFEAKQERWKDEAARVAESCSVD